MKHFLIDITYIKPLEKIAEILSQHREYLQAGYDSAVILYSGPKNPKTGGIVLARAESKKEIELFIASDPYKKNNCAEYRITEFDPVKRQSFMESWVTGT